MAGPQKETHKEKRMKKALKTIAPVVLAGMFVLGSVPKALAGQCSNASLKGAYGFLDSHISVPAGTPFTALGRWSFDGKGNFTNTITFNDNGTVTPHAPDFGTYTVNADCTGKILIIGGTGTVEIVLVDGGKEFYGLATNPSSIVVLFSVAKKQFPDDER
jgi:hypothetical protein